MVRYGSGCAAGLWMAVNDSTAAVLSGGTSKLYCHVWRSISSCDPTPIEARALVGVSNVTCPNNTRLASRCTGSYTGDVDSVILTHNLPNPYFRFETIETSCSSNVYNSDIMTIHLEYSAGYTIADVGLIIGFIAASAAACALIVVCCVCLRKRLDDVCLFIALWCSAKDVRRHAKFESVPGHSLTLV